MGIVVLHHLHVPPLALIREAREDSGQFHGSVPLGGGTVVLCVPCPGLRGNAERILLKQLFAGLSEPIALVIQLYKQPSG